ncbi:MAG: ORF6N domain-containing protein, partial [Planctomycetes bacterium]|nr:ORF6N domain-containing protein [Planctomycetota bacterium]
MLGRTLTPQAIERAIHRIRGHRVMLDADLARLYGVETKALNQAVKRNASRFPEDFLFRLTAEEADNLKSQIVTSSWRKMDALFVVHASEDRMAVRGSRTTKCVS